MLRTLHSDKAAENFEDEAAATEGYFQTSPSKAKTIVAAVSAQCYPVNSMLSSKLK